ncbi:MAG TPA: helix-turn-helix transcriptional regulator [Cyclobacteriaceae bacterium]|nr:helix-turn-helix transcriptional regulator [Cyclobacteriaceae bacterium]
MILKLLAEGGKMYGYEMAQRVREQSGNKILIKDGSLYPALQRMTEDGLVSFKEEMVGGRVRKYYYLTPKGKKQAVASLKELEDFISTISLVAFPKSKLKTI